MLEGCSTAPCYGNSDARIEIDGTEAIQFAVGQSIRKRCSDIVAWTNPLYDTTSVENEPAWTMQTFVAMEVSQGAEKPAFATVASES